MPSATHGLSSLKIYQIWDNMLSRCYNPRDISFKNYGGRGIVVDKDWHKIENFYRDMGDVPNGKSIDRIDNDGPYCKDNCRWATRREQSRNTSRNVWIVFRDEIKLAPDWATELGIPISTVMHRFKHGHPIDKPKVPKKRF